MEQPRTSSFLCNPSNVGAGHSKHLFEHLGSCMLSQEREGSWSAATEKGRAKPTHKL